MKIKAEMEEAAVYKLLLTQINKLLSDKTRDVQKKLITSFNNVNSHKHIKILPQASTVSWFYKGIKSKQPYLLNKLTIIETMFWASTSLEEQGRVISKEFTIPNAKELGYSHPKVAFFIQQYIREKL
jgi:hypothetical protein